MKQKLVASILILTMLLGVVPSTAFAADGYIYIGNGDTATEIAKSSVHSVQCGNGTATYDPDTNTLTLCDVNINTTRYSAILISGMSELKIVLKGANVITTTNENSTNGVGINAASVNLNIVSELGGTLEIDAASNGILAANIALKNISSLKIGERIPIIRGGAIGGNVVSVNDSVIKVGKGSRNALIGNISMEISNSEIIANNITGTAITVNASPLKIENSTVEVSSVKNTDSTLDDYLIASIGEISIKNSVLTAVNNGTKRGISAGTKIEIDNIDADKKISVVSNGITAASPSGTVTMKGTIDLTSNNNTSINASKVEMLGGDITLISKSNYGTWISGDLSISDAKVTASGAYSGLGSSANINIKNSVVNTIGTGDYYSIYALNGKVSISGDSDVTAEGKYGIYASGLAILPDDGQSVGVEVGSKVNGEVKASHFNRYGVESPFNTATEFTGNALTAIKSYSYFHSKTKYIVSAAANDGAFGNITGDGTYAYGEEITLNAEANPGYKFVKWTEHGADIANAGAVYTFNVTAGRVLTAVFAPETYTIQFDGNGATNGATTPQAMTYDVVANLNKNGYEKAGSIFVAWNTQADGQGIGYADKAEVKNLTTKNNDTVILYAIWGDCDHKGSTTTPSCIDIAVCSICGSNIAVLGHNFANIWSNDAENHWYDCSRCDVNKGKAVHDYTNDCDAQCNVCEYTRSITHNYVMQHDVSEHWNQCNVCNNEELGSRTAHNYDNGSDTDCNVCGYTRMIIPPVPPSTPSTDGSSGFTGDYNYPVTIDTTDGAAVSLSEEYAVAGDTVTITVTPDEGRVVDTVIITDEDGNVLEITKVGTNQYTFIMPEGEVSINVTTKAAAYDTKIVMQIGSLYMTVNGTTFQNDVAPKIVNNRTVLPIRVVAEALGADVAWDAELQKVTITKGDTVIELFIGKYAALVNGEPVQLDAAPFIDNNRTYLPVRFVSEYLGATVDWDVDTQTVTIWGNK